MTRSNLRILCLHGFRSSGRALQLQMRPLTNITPMADFTFINAPESPSGKSGWWRAIDDEPSADGTVPARVHYEGWARSRDAVLAFISEHGPFDGILGFSQGAAFAGVLVGLRAPDGRPTAERPLRIDFAMLVGGFPSRDPDLARLYERRDAYALPSLHMIGLSDAIVPAETSRALATHFIDPVLVEHPGGHVVATEPPALERVTTFLEARLRAKAAATP